MEFVDKFGLDPNIAYTPKINDAMLDMVMQQDIDAGISHEKAKQNRMEAAADLNKLMAKNGMFK